MSVNDDLPIRTDKPVHSGKVRAVYWLTAADSARLIEQRKYDVPADAELAIMVISDRISAYECIWRGVGGLQGVPGKGAALNAISNHWFQLFKDKGLANSHILEVPHPPMVRTMELLEELGRETPGRVRFIHLNHTNPALNRDDLQAEIRERGFPVAEVGERVRL